MELKSLGFKTDLFFTKLDGQVLDRGSYLVVKTLSNPNYFWGNLLIFDQAPGPSDFERWTTLFKWGFVEWIGLSDKPSFSEMKKYPQADELDTCE